MHELIAHWIATWFGWVRDFGYPGVVVLMALESTVFPVPSEVVIPPAAFWASQGHMTISGVILSGTLGSLIGSAISYWMARWAGRFAIAKLGHRFFINEEKLERAERFLRLHGAGGLFFARLLPVLRHVISLPAGILRMDFWRFSVMTATGSAAWCGVLAWVGVRVAQRDPGLIENPEAMIAAVKHESIWFVVAVLVMAGLYALMMRMTARRAA